LLVATNKYDKQAPPHMIIVAKIRYIFYVDDNINLIIKKPPAQNIRKVGIKHQSK
jgi:hypothetical protein